LIPVKKGLAMISRKLRDLFRVGRKGADLDAASSTATAQPVRTCFDAFVDGRIVGWAWNSGSPDTPVYLELRLGDDSLSVRPANLYRSDLQEAGMNEGRCAFQIDVPSTAIEKARATGDSLTVRTVGGVSVDVCKISLIERLSPNEALRADLRNKLVQIGENFARIRSEGPDPAISQTVGQRPLPAYTTLLEWPRTQAPASGRGERDLSPFCDYVRFSHQLQNRFTPEMDPADADHFHRWYVEFYGETQRPARIPLSAGLVRYLGETITIGGRPLSLSRIMLWYLVEDGNTKMLLRRDDESHYRELIYWWAVEQAPRLGLEDCLVTRQQIELLRNVPDNWLREAFPLSNYVEVAIKRCAKLSDLGSIFDVETRLTIYMFLLFEALKEPGILRFIPKGVIDRFFGANGALFSQLVEAIGVGMPSIAMLDAETYRQLLAEASFDLSTLRFTTVDPRGHRIEAARRTLPNNARLRDVQVIGPFAKVSGIARASQISRSILNKVDLDCAFVNFTMGNEQPDMPKFAENEGCGRAAINILHLNADVLPNALAYLPDVFTQAYNIGFFFWELNEPASCHRLAFELVDEIWVASEFNRRCFSAYTSKPVVNVGSALNDIVVPERLAARARLDRLLGSRPEQFVFLSTFDSLSYLQRKNPLGLIRAFQKAFPLDENVCLAIKTHNSNSLSGTVGVRYWDSILRACDEDSRIKIISETLSFEALTDIMVASDCYVSLHRSEGLGFGMLEAMSLGVPVVCTGYSGNLDFCNADTAWLVDYDEIALAPDDYAYVLPSHRWAEPRDASAMAALQSVRCDVVERERRVMTAQRLVRERYSLDAAALRYADRLNAILQRSRTSAANG
jgi:glycosyltransferase involved in cell wall biosynthesis